MLYAENYIAENPMDPRLWFLSEVIGIWYILEQNNIALQSSDFFYAFRVKGNYVLAME